MTNDSFSTIPATPESLGARYLQAATSWQMAVARSVLLAQLGQWEILAAWWRGTAAAQHELVDQWICRFGGGVPLDG
ncbi:UNVERIFIED_ORG: hypothetical protein ABIC43_002410 [Variovorax guangxiensis]